VQNAQDSLHCEYIVESSCIRFWSVITRRTIVFHGYTATRPHTEQVFGELESAGR